MGYDKNEDVCVCVGGRRMSVCIYVHVCVFIGCCLATKCLNLITQSGMDGGEVWQWVAMVTSIK